jgi:hypothetical protein
VHISSKKANQALHVKRDSAAGDEHLYVGAIHVLTIACHDRDRSSRIGEC